MNQMGLKTGPLVMSSVMWQRGGINDYDTIVLNRLIVSYNIY